MRINEDRESSNKPALKKHYEKDPGIQWGF